MAAILKIYKSPYLSENPPIFMKFGTLHQILNPITVTWPKIEIFRIQDGGSRHLENRYFGHNSSTDCPISVNEEAERYVNEGYMTKTANV